MNAFGQPEDDTQADPLAEGDAQLEQPEEEAPEPEPNPLTTYWAAGTPEQCIAMLSQKEDEFFQTALARGFVNMWRIANANIYGQDPYTPGQFDTQTIGVEDADGGQLRFRVNEPASFLRQQVTMATGQRAAFQAVAENTDTAALAMTQTVDSAVDYFYRKNMPDSKEQTFVRTEGGFGAAYVWWRWDKWAGDEVEVGAEQVQLPPDKQPTEVQQGLAPPQTAPVPVFGPSGAPVSVILRPWEEFHEVMRRGGQQLWRCALERRSRWELMAMFPAIADKLRDISSDPNVVEQQLFGQYYYLQTTDDVVVHHFYHVPIGDPNDKSNPLRAGRYLAYVGDTLLPGCDTRLPTSRKVGLPIVEGMSLPMEDIAFGVASWWDLIACQQGQDQVVSDVLSNINTFGRTSGFYPEGADIDLDALAAGGGWFQVPANASAPQLLNPPQMPQIASWVSDYCDKKKQALSGLNAVTRGDPGSNISSGEMAALFTNLSVEFNSDKQMMVDEMRRSSANIVADLIDLNAETDLLVQVAGLDERPYIVKFRKEHLKGVRSIEMQSAPPMMRNAAGRMQIFKMLEGVPPNERAAAIMLINTGQWRQMTDTSSAQWLLIKYENERLAKGIKFPPPPMPVPGQPPPDPTMLIQQKAQLIGQQLGVKVSATDDDKAHLEQHAMLYNQLAIDPETNADAIATVLAHIQATIASYYRKDPMLAALLGQQPPPPPPQPAGGTMPGVHPGVPQKPGEDKGSPVPNGSSQKPDDRLGPGVPQPAQPPKGAAVPNAPAEG